MQLLAEGNLEALREALQDSILKLDQVTDLSPDEETPVSNNFSEQLMAPLQGQGQPASITAPRPSFQNYIKE